MHGEESKSCNLDGFTGGAASLRGGRGGASSGGKTEEDVQEVIGTGGKWRERVKDVK